MDPREALDITIKAFGLKAADLARDTGVTVQTLSRYRKKHQDMNSLNAFDVIKALPSHARDLFWSLLLLEGSPDLYERLNSTSPKFLHNEIELALGTQGTQRIEGGGGKYKSDMVAQLARQIFLKESSAESPSDTLIESLVIKYVTQHIGTALRQELTENPDSFKLIVKEYLDDIVDQENLSLINKKKQE